MFIHQQLKGLLTVSPILLWHFLLKESNSSQTGLAAEWRHLPWLSNDADLINKVWGLRLSSNKLSLVFICSVCREWTQEDKTVRGSFYINRKQKHTPPFSFLSTMKQKWITESLKCDVISVIHLLLHRASALWCGKTGKTGITACLKLHKSPLTSAAAGGERKTGHNRHVSTHCKNKKRKIT